MSVVMKIFKDARWYVGQLMGDHDYQKYCNHLRIHHPNQPIPTEREYWRNRHAAADANPQARCC